MYFIAEKIKVDVFLIQKQLKINSDAITHYYSPIAYIINKGDQNLYSFYFLFINYSLPTGSYSPAMKPNIQLTA